MFTEPTGQIQISLNDSTTTLSLRGIKGWHKMKAVITHEEIFFILKVLSGSFH